MPTVGLSLHLRLTPKRGAPQKAGLCHTKSTSNMNWNVFLSHTRVTTQVRLPPSSQGQYSHIQTHMYTCIYTCTGPAQTLCWKLCASRQRCTCKLSVIEYTDCTSQRNTVLSGVRFPSSPQSPPHFSVSENNPTKTTLSQARKITPGKSPRVPGHQPFLQGGYKTGRGKAMRGTRWGGSLI